MKVKDDNDAITCIVAVVMAGSVLATPYYGFGPVLVVSAGLLVAAGVGKVLTGDEDDRSR